MVILLLLTSQGAIKPKLSNNLFQKEINNSFTNAGLLSMKILKVKELCYFLMLFSFCVILASCAGGGPAKVDVQLPDSKPEEKVTSFTKALRDLGLMTEIYDTGLLKVQSNPIGDNTGTSGATGGEIPRDITEMIKSSLNSVGGNVMFIPYDPAYIQNQMVTGYSNFDDKQIPDVVISGGITEFDRGLETHGSGTDFSADANYAGSLPSEIASKSLGIEYSDGSKTGLARITLDFNMLDFKTLAGIPRMNTVNTMEVNKALSEKELGITLLGVNFGSKGSVKKVQGRHNAVRLLVELSMVQMIGKHLILPYWNLLGEDAGADEVVLGALRKSYYKMNDNQTVYNAQKWLYLHGYDVKPTGNLDEVTVTALKSFSNGYAPSGSRIDEKVFIDLYTKIPVEEKTLGRKMQLASLSGVAPTMATQSSSSQTSVASPAVQRSQQAQPAQPAQQAQRASAPQQAAPVSGSTGIGRILKDDEW